MEIKLSEEESIEMFYNSLCNIYETGYWSGYGLKFDWSDEDYRIAKFKLKSPCIEDILLQILTDGNKISVIDEQGGGDMNRNIILQNVINRVQKAPIQNLVNIIEENDDVCDADVILQTVFFESVIFS